MWFVQELYGGRLSAHVSVAGHTMAELAGSGAEAGELPVLLLIDSAGCDMDEQAEEEGDSKVRRRPVGGRDNLGSHQSQLLHSCSLQMLNVRSGTMARPWQ